MNDSSATTFRDKVTLLNNTALKDFEKTIKNLKTENILIETELDRLGAKRFLKEHDLTDLIKKLISKKELESISKLFLFKPKFNASAIAKNLSDETHKASPDMWATYNFTQQLMLKLNYDVGDYYVKMLNSNQLLTSFIFTPIVGLVNGLKITDYMANGCLFTPPKSRVSSQMLLSIPVTCHQLFYSTGKFQSPTYLSSNNNQVFFSDEKLQRYIRTSPPSEDDLKEFILDLLTKVGFDLDTIYPEKDFLKEGTILSQLRQVAEMLPLPKPNAFSKALDEYDQMQAKKQTQAEKL